MDLKVKDIRISYKNFANKLATVAEAHDQETGNHILRVGKLSSFIADKLGLSNEKTYCKRKKIAGGR